MIIIARRTHWSGRRMPDPDARTGRRWLSRRAYRGGGSAEARGRSCAAGLLPRVMNTGFKRLGLAGVLLPALVLLLPIAPGGPPGDGGPVGLKMGSPDGSAGSPFQAGWNGEVPTGTRMIQRPVPPSGDETQEPARSEIVDPGRIVDDPAYGLRFERPNGCRAFHPRFARCRRQSPWQPVRRRSWSLQHPA